MKNKLIIIFLILTFNLSSLNFTAAQEFNFNTTELQILENGNILKGINGGEINTKDNEIVISADNFEYNKLTTLLKAKGNVRLIDKIADIIIETNEIVYLKNKEEIYTKGKSKALKGKHLQIDAIQYFKYNKTTSLLEAKGNVVFNEKNKNITIYTNEILYSMNEEKISSLGKTNINVKDKYNIEGNNLILLKDKMVLFSKKKAIITDIVSNTYKLEKFQYSIDKEILKVMNVRVRHGI
jgi:LPS-assembly protein